MNKKHLAELEQQIQKIASKEEAKAFITTFFTPAERDTLVERVQIIKLLQQGLTQREVAKKLGVSLATVNRGAQELKYSKHPYIV